MKKDKAQEEVICTVDGQMIVIACPGSGKTTTLIRRINHMITNTHINPENILMVTFTNASAKEMRDRYRKQFGNDDVTFCTIHSLCLAILKKFCNYSSDDLITDSRSFFYERLKKNKRINDKDEFITSLITEISVVKNNKIIVDEYHPKCCEDQKLFIGLYNEYEKYKKLYHLIDFDDMLILSYQVMTQNNECLSWLQEKYQYIQIDEFQDINCLQRDIMYLLAGTNGNIAVVGDDDQSIYGFRGAMPEIMLNFKKHYPNAKAVRMNTNYRSDRKIIKYANSLIKKNKKRFSKQFLCSHNSAGEVEITYAENREQELDMVIKRIQDLISAGENPSDIAVLFRTNKQAEAIATRFIDKQISFVSTEGIKSRYEHWMFSDIRSYFKLATDNYSNIDLLRVINRPQRYLLDSGYITAGLDKRAMRRVASLTCENEWKRNNAFDKITDFLHLIERLENQRPKEFLDILYKFGKYDNYLTSYADFRNIDKSELEDVWNSYVIDAEKHNTWVGWGKYIIGYNKAIKEIKNNSYGVVLSTMHCSKGLEWKYVFIVDCVEGSCPFAKAKTRKELEEERRLFYVAMTRAKEHLYLYSYKIKGSKTIKPSRFLAELNVSKL